MLTVNFMFWWRLCEPMYASYIMCIAALMGWVLFATGLIYSWIPPDAAWSLPSSLSGLLVATAYAAMLLFIRQYLELREQNRLADRLLQGLMFAFAAVTTLYLVPVAAKVAFVSNLATAVFALMPPLLLFVLLRLSVAGFRAAWLFLIAWLPLGALSMARTLAGRALQFRDERDRALRLAAVDPLTGVLNRRAGEDRLTAMLHLARRRQRPLTVMFVDLDLLKVINDSHGHPGGRCLPARAGQSAPAAAAATRGLGALGRREFLLLLPGFALDAAEVLAGRILDAARRDPVEFEGEALPLGVSLGLGDLRPDDTAYGLIQRADKALYTAKRGGRMRLAIAPQAG